MNTAIRGDELTPSHLGQHITIAIDRLSITDELVRLHTYFDSEQVKVLVQMRNTQPKRSSVGYDGHIFGDCFEISADSYVKVHGKDA